MLECIKGVAGRFRVAFGRILSRYEIEHTGLVVEVDQPAQVIHVIHIRVIRMQFDEALGGCQRLRLIGLTIVGVGNFHLRLHRVGAERIARFQAFKQLDRALVITAR